MALLGGLRWQQLAPQPFQDAHAVTSLPRPAAAVGRQQLICASRGQLHLLDQAQPDEDPRARTNTVLLGRGSAHQQAHAAP